MSMNTVTALTCHDDVWLLLPWYVNQSLSGEERELVEEHLKGCVTCRGELNIQRKLQEEVRNSETAGLCEHIQLENLIQKIQESGGGGSDDSGSALKKNRSTVVYALAASLLLLAVLPLGIWPPEERDYSTLSSPQPATFSSARENDIRVIFSETLSPAGRQQLLARINGRIVEESDSNGVRLIRIDNAGSLLNMTKVLAYLNKHPQVVFVEPAVSAD